jgi:hypothetical protein
MATHNLKYSLSGSGKALERTVSPTGTGVVLIDGETVATGETDSEINFDLDVSACTSFFLVSDQDVTFETNDGDTADDTLSLKAGVPYVWHEDAYVDFLLGTDVTSVFITNASGSTATIYCVALYDATPA